MRLVGVLRRHGGILEACGGAQGEFFYLLETFFIHDRWCKDCKPSGISLFHDFRSNNQNVSDLDENTKRSQSLKGRKSWNTVKINGFCCFSYFVS